MGDYNGVNICVYIYMVKLKQERGVKTFLFLISWIQMHGTRDLNKKV